MSINAANEVVADKATNEAGSATIDTQEDPGLFKGVVDNVVFHNEGNGWTVLIGRKPDGKTEKLVGTTHRPAVGMQIEARGERTADPKFGEQFSFKQITFSQPSDNKGIVRYLASGVLPGIGEILASRIVEAFGDNSYDVISKEPQRLLAISGITEKRVKAIQEAWLEEESTRELRTFLLEYGIGPRTAIKISKEFEGISTDDIRQNPYMIAKVDGVGFKTADKIAISLGVESTSVNRISAGLIFTLQAAEKSGHNFLYIDELERSAGKLLGINDIDTLHNVIMMLVTKATFSREPVNGRAAIYLKKMAQYEFDVAERVVTIKENQYGVDVDLSEDEITLYEKRNDIKIQGSQLEAIKGMTTNKLSILTGGPGTGKTTIVDAYLNIIGKRVSEDQIVLGAPTGRAAQRLSESTDREANTVHRMLGANAETGHFRFNKNNPLEGEVFVLDESSMMGQKMMAKFLTSIPDNAHVLFVGDVNQLPSVEAGRVLRDLINSGGVYVATLTEVHRQAKDSKIVMAAHDIINDKIPVLSGNIDDDLFMAESSAQNAQGSVIDMVTAILPEQGFDPVRDVQVLTPMHKGSLGTSELNILLQEALNPNLGKGIKRYNGFEFCLGDKVLQTKNNYDMDIYNGDVGFVTEVDLEGMKIKVDFNGREVSLKASDLDDLTLAYAMTIHKSQGSEYPAVVMPMSTEHRVMLRRELVYTGLTRGKKKVALVGDKGAFEYAIQNHANDPRLTRNTYLAERIQKLTAERKAKKESGLSSMFGRSVRPRR